MRTNKEPDRKRRVVNFLEWSALAMVLSGSIGVGYAAYVLGIGQVYQALEMRKFEHETPLIEPHVPVMGESIGEIAIPSVGLHAVILQGDSQRILRLGVGHLPETAMPGETGNVGLAGHRDTFFRPLRRIKVGELITLRTEGLMIRYRVESTRIVSPSEISVLGQSNNKELTLVTCYPFDYVGPAPYRFVVRAVEMDTSLP